ncbi:MAG: alpha/beta fold hydrolase [Actinobacteria bacterium]|nr:MAG: alpha/beta fold hydrolase [Actinomycetota bacterium]
MTFEDVRNGLRELDERSLEVHGSRVRYYVGGDGPPLLLVHGLSGAAANWVALAPLLVERFRVLIPDLPGHAGSSPLAGVKSLDPFAETVVALAEHERMLPAALVGHSLGGLVALRLAVRRPEAVSGLVLVSAAGISTATRRVERLLRVSSFVRPSRFYSRFRARVGRSLALRYLVFGYWGASDPAALPPHVVEGFLSGPALHTDTLTAARALARDDPRLDLELVRCPSLVLWGARDRQVPVADAFEYARRLRAPVRLVADCGHLPIGERPDACADAITTFLT